MLKIDILRPIELSRVIGAHLTECAAEVYLQIDGSLLININIAGLEKIKKLNEGELENKINDDVPLSVKL